MRAAHFLVKGPDDDMQAEVVGLVGALLNAVGVPFGR